jgi:hypothetical protein
MTTRGVALKLLHCAVFLAVMFVAIQVAIVIGVERKSWLQLSWEFLVGGSLGAIAGVVFFVIFGAIGWVCGALYGGLGLLSLMVGGALGGLGLGAVANIARNPHEYNFHWPSIIAVLVVGSFVAQFLSSMALRAAVRSTAAQKAVNHMATDA